MAYCPYCGRKKHKGLCDMIRLADGRVVHASRVDSGDLANEKIANRFIKRDEKKLA